MHSIRKRLSIILIFCSIISVLLSALFVNAAINRTFNSYMEDIQGKRNARLVDYFQQIYLRDRQWNSNSGEEMIHEAHMGNYCLTLLDKDKRVVWAMDPNDIRYKDHIMLNGEAEEGVYTTNTFEIVVEGKVAGYLVVGQYSPVLLSKEDIDFKGRVNKSIVFSVIATIVVVACISLMLSKQFSSPIKVVSDTSVRLSKGNYEARSAIKSNIVELHNLIFSINSLGEKLNSQDLLRKRLVTDITHEIRTPLNVLQNNLEAMIDGIIPVTEERLNVLNDEVVRFGKLLNNLNALKELEAEDIEMHMGNVQIDKLISSLFGSFKVSASEKNVILQLEKDKDRNFTVLGDEDKLKQVFINLISNAIKFTNPYGKVWVKIKADEDFIIVEVEDTGIGIKEEDLPYVFERLYRGDKSRHQIEGSGIGLTLAKKILTLHSAYIDVVSKENVGTKFTVKFNDIEDS